LGRPEEALSELEVLKEIAPDEANVWFLSGRLCKMLGRKAEAVRAFTVALNLDPKVCDVQFVVVKQMLTLFDRLPNSSKTLWSRSMMTKTYLMQMAMKIWTECLMPTLTMNMICQLGANLDSSISNPQSIDRAIA